MDTPIDRKDIIDGLGKGLRVIEAFDDDHPRLTPSEAAALSGMTRTAARRYLLSLVHFGYADGDGKHFWLLPKVLRLGQSYLGAARLPRLVQPFIQRLSQATGETFNFSVLDGHEIVYLARSNSPRVISIGFQPGARVPAHAVTPSVPILATYTDEALAEWIATHEFTAFGPQTQTDAALFRDNVLGARRLSFWVTEQQLEPGLRGIAVAIKDRKGVCRGAIGSTMPMQNENREAMVARVLPLLQECAQSLRPVM
ncbi:IclR family transcriptional regulator domain-containing protein [Leptothrix discophora]|uniref:IclR family transcriptional regulator C-terminal domain-containing protein n=1 Tax=Leptothrix discophora TaxID=89 RepID=A0ABT9FY64_LEPDI|nr:IclR family transcriptional regulator C-terminal domain-containing protein [Leptothrix discophora]MDP4299169.1 IclR family transcriptional regulator C-terminal domain-containing protein [Leptothrix discophora]